MRRIPSSCTKIQQRKKISSDSSLCTGEREETHEEQQQRHNKTPLRRKSIAALSILAFLCSCIFFSPSIFRSQLGTRISSDLLDLLVALSFFFRTPKFLSLPRLLVFPLALFPSLLFFAFLALARIASASCVSSLVLSFVQFTPTFYRSPCFANSSMQFDRLSEIQRASPVEKHSWIEKMPKCEKAKKAFIPSLLFPLLFIAKTKKHSLPCVPRWSPS